jgi:hypothetical protein
MTDETSGVNETTADVIIKRAIESAKTEGGKTSLAMFTRTDTNTPFGDRLKQSEEKKSKKNT